MQTFSTIEQRARKRHGGEQALNAMLPRVRSARGVARLGDDRFLAQMTRCVFQAGFVWRVVDRKWDDFEDVFFGFPPERIVMLSPEQMERFGSDPRIIRNMQKVNSVQHNARYILDVAKEHGSFARFVARWASEDLIGLFAHMKRGGCRLGGMTGPRVLRNLGRDCFILTPDVVRCLQGAGLDIKDNPTSQREQRLVQAAFNNWHEQSGLPYAHLSRIAACSVG